MAILPNAMNFLERFTLSLVDFCDKKNVFFVRCCSMRAIFIVFVSCAVFIFPVFCTGEMRPGTLVFETIRQLPREWWKKPHLVWSVWNPRTYYLWGANRSNYAVLGVGKRLHGSGMASASGPTRGRGHPHYRGIITTTLSHTENDAVFADLKKKMREGAHIHVPVQEGRYSLGTGSAVCKYTTMHGWYRSQKYIAKQLIALGKLAREVHFSKGVFWPDCWASKKSAEAVLLPLQSLEDLERLVDYLETRLELH